MNSKEFGRKILVITTFVLCLFACSNTNTSESSNSNNETSDSVNTSEEISSEVEKNLYEYYENDDGTLTITRYIGNEKVVTIPSNVSEISARAFSGNNRITEVIIPKSVNFIGKGIFEDCLKIERLTLPFVGESRENNQYLGYIFGTLSYFDNSKYVPESLKEIIILESCIRIGDYAFSGCTSLTSITIPSCVTSIGDYAFRDCSSLTSITIPSSVTSIGSSAFDECTSLTSITIPSSVTSIGYSAFGGCTSLTIYCEAESKPSGWSLDWRCSIGDYSNRPIVWGYVGENGIYNGLQYAVVKIEGNKYITIIGYDGKNTSIDIPESINGIQVTAIANNAFNDCRSLTSVTIPSSVTSIGSSAFGGCTSLKTMTLPFIGGSKDSNRYLGYIFGASKCTDNLEYVLSSLKEIIILDSCTSIGRLAFSGCRNLTSVTIPSSVTYIGNSAFSGCSSLTSIVIPNSVTDIRVDAFYDCTSLTSITIPSSCTSIGGLAFMHCTSLTSITIPSSVTSIGNYAFEGCSSLTIYCEAENKPSNWDSNWNVSNRPVIWGYIK